MRTFFFDSRDHSLSKTLSMGVKGEGYREADAWEMGWNRPKSNSITQPRPLPAKPSRRRFNIAPTAPPATAHQASNALAKFLL